MLYLFGAASFGFDLLTRFALSACNIDKETSPLALTIAIASEEHQNCRTYSKSQQFVTHE